MSTDTQTGTAPIEPQPKQLAKLSQSLGARPKPVRRTPPPDPSPTPGTTGTAADTDTIPTTRPTARSQDQPPTPAQDDPGTGTSPAVPAASPPRPEPAPRTVDGPTEPTPPTPEPDGPSLPPADQTSEADQPTATPTAAATGTAPEPGDPRVGEGPSDRTRTPSRPRPARAKRSTPADRRDPTTPAPARPVEERRGGDAVRAGLRRRRDQAVFYVPISVSDQLRDLARRENKTNADVIFDAIEFALPNLQTLLETPSPSPAGGGMFQRAEPRPVGRKVQVSAVVSDSNLAVIDRLAEEHAAPSRSELVEVSLSAYFADLGIVPD